MNELIDIITELLGIPYVEENSPVFDGSFALVPIMTSGLQGNGKVATSKTTLNIELFYSDKADCISAATSLWKEICATPCMTAENPDYTFEADATMWRASLPIEIVDKEE